jgi:ATP synthase F1 delta subunit
LELKRLHGGDVNFRFAPFMKRYANVLLHICEDPDTCKALKKDWRLLEAVLHADPEGWRFLISPLLSRAQKQELLINLAKQLKLSPFMQRFLFLLVHHRRLALLKEVMASFLEKLAAQTGAYKVRLVTARALSKQEMEALHAVLQKTLHLPQQIQLVPEVQPDILGGVVLFWGQFQLDASVATGLQRLRQQLQVEG